MKEEHKVDQFFKAGLSEPEIPFQEGHWEAMAAKLDAEQKKRSIPMWLIAASSVAAVLLIGVFLFFSGSDKAPDKIKENSAVLAQPEAPAAPAAEGHHPKAALPVERTADLLGPALSAPIKEAMARPSEEKMQQALSNRDSLQQPVLPMLAGVQLIEPQLRLEPDPIADHSTQRILDVSAEKRRPWAFSVMVAPDRSTTRSSVSSGLSSNVGILATYSLGRRLSLTSGLIYAKKLYNYTGLTAGSYGNSSWEVDADCRVLDIPLNLNYKLFQRRRFSLTMQSGLSSYFMLNERYKYISGQPGEAQKTSVLELENENRHLFGVANFSVSFEQKISRQFSIGVQPFYKLPLTGIGLHDANLQSKGISFSVSVNPF